mmetsp:Transcript_80631/g.228407  ORF Transcript_80631/g.228407 Transcript_80631/m.228407 type:complete len:566 (+) Transcript_80631:155-1852(+)
MAAKAQRGGWLEAPWTATETRTSPPLRSRPLCHRPPPGTPEREAPRPDQHGGLKSWTLARRSCAPSLLRSSNVTLPRRLGRARWGAPKISAPAVPPGGELRRMRRTRNPCLVQAEGVAVALHAAHVDLPPLRGHAEAVGDHVAVAPDVAEADPLVHVLQAADRLPLVQLDHRLLAFPHAGEEEVRPGEVRPDAGGEGLGVGHDPVVELLHEGLGARVGGVGQGAVHGPAVLVAVDHPGARADVAAAGVLADEEDLVHLAPDQLHLRLQGLHGRPAGLEQLLHRDARLQVLPEVLVGLAGELAEHLLLDERHQLRHLVRVPALLQPAAHDLHPPAPREVRGLDDHGVHPLVAEGHHVGREGLGVPVALVRPEVHGGGGDPELLRQALEEDLVLDEGDVRVQEAVDVVADHVLVGLVPEDQVGLVEERPHREVLRGVHEAAVGAGGELPGDLEPLLLQIGAAAAAALPLREVVVAGEGALAADERGGLVPVGARGPRGCALLLGEGLLEHGAGAPRGLGLQVRARLQGCVVPRDGSRVRAVAERRRGKGGHRGENVREGLQSGHRHA